MKNTCRVRLLSDLHAEGGCDPKLFKSQGEDVLVIAGDLHVGADATWSTLKQFYEHQPNIVYVFGNHEFYRQEYYETCRKLEDWSSGTGIHVLNPGTVFWDPKLCKLVPTAHIYEHIYAPTLEDMPIAFIGAPLWTNFRNNDLSKFHAKSRINDFRLIRTTDQYYNQRPLTPDDAQELYNQQYGYIKHQYESIKLKKVIVTHFLPADECVDMKYRGASTAMLNDYFANDLGNWISTLENVPLFLHGHTHDNVDTMIGTTRIVANPYGYGKNYNYKECLIDL